MAGRALFSMPSAAVGLAPAQAARGRTTCSGSSSHHSTHTRIPRSRSRAVVLPRLMAPAASTSSGGGFAAAAAAGFRWDRAARGRCSGAVNDPGFASADGLYEDDEEDEEDATKAMLKKAMMMAAEEDDDEDVDDEELAALEAEEGWGALASVDEDGMEVAKGVAAAFVGTDEETADSSEEGSGSYDEEDEEDEEDDVEGVALLRELFEYGGVEVTEWMNLGEDEDVEVSGIANDSRVVLGGDVFVCIKGAEADGHAYALDAVAAGAVVVVCSEPIEELSDDTPQVIVPDTSTALPRLAAAFYGNPSTALTTVGVTGTNGKTTTTHLVRSILEAAGMPCGVIGTVGYEMDDIKLTPHGGVWEPEEEDPTAGRRCTKPGWLAPYKGKYEVPNTTPDALQCQQLLAGMLDNGASAATMEVSSHALAQGRVDCCDFDVAVFTNLTQDHLDFHGSMENYREAKAELFRRLTDPERQRAVINLDGPRDPDDRVDYNVIENGIEEEDANEEDDFDNAAYFIEAAGGGGRVPIITYATHSDKADEADVFVEKVELTLFETALTIRTPVGSIDAVCGIVGRVNVSNIAAAVAVGVALEIPLDVIAAGVEAMEPVPGRMELVDEGQPFPVVVDYAHTPDALARAIKSVRQMGAENILTVFGCGGDRDPTKRAEMGRVADAYSDIVFVTNDNPRTEDPYKILDDVVAGFRDRIYELEIIKEEAMFPFLKDMYLIHPNARHETMKLQNMCRRYVIVDRWHAIRAAVAMAGEKDAVLICGKGHEDYIVVGQKKHWFDDRVEARDALQKIVAVQEAGVDTTNLPWTRVGATPGTGNVLDA